MILPSDANKKEKEMANKDITTGVLTDDVSLALKHERKKQPKGKNHYKIFRVEKDRKTGEELKITMTKFWASDEHEAYEELKKYRKVANKAYTYYFGTTGNYIGNSLDEKGRVKRYDSLSEMMKAEHSKRTFLDKILEIVKSPFENIWDKFCKVKWSISDAIYFLKTKHKKSESWSLDSHLIDDILFNIPKLLNDRHGYPAHLIYKARSEINKKKGIKIDIEKSMEEDPNPTDEEEQLADEMWNKELKTGLMYARLYKFYTNFGIIDDNASEEEKKFLKSWEKTIPYIPGTYKEIDYKKLHILTDKYWNSLWNWIKENGRSLWD